MSVAKVQQWCRDAKAPVLNDEAAAEIARMLNTALFEDANWKPEFAAQRQANPNTLCLKRIATALFVLRDELPKALADSRKVSAPDADHSATEALLDLVQSHQAIIDKFGPNKQGRPPELAGNLAVNIGKKFIELMSYEERPSKKAVSAMVGFAMTWLNAGPKKDEAVSRSRRRRTK
jgi:hypothetical protein